MICRIYFILISISQFLYKKCIIFIYYRINDLANECDVPVEVNCSNPLHYTKQKGRDSDTFSAKSYTSQTKVCLVNHKVYTNRQNETIETTNCSYKEKPSTIFLGTGSNYWFIYINKIFLKKADISKTATVFKKKLPYSFLWLLHQCCRVLDCHMSELYLELMDLENKFSTFLQPDKTTNQSECEEMFSNITL